MSASVCFSHFTNACIGEIPFQLGFVQFSSDIRLENIPSTGFLPFPVSLPCSPT